ncbi:MAG TPA: acyltransferase family protein [Sphingomonas sp.]|uniref:acyltransferase family protein n=1 Tax=Sphingomonas sp. TaxID=28214 RepID=UPI002CA05AF3|nr:acyltransferase family protein [Sphingomonas sp.]HMI18738.1 acyltransferase family protein [Sphingomonas sp.]
MSGEPHPIRYRPDIDGLRAIAVVAVVLFHAELVSFPAGFMGVDVFFVISGYLITGILMKDTSIIRFYQRRARRILPALFVMLAAVLAAGVFMLLPHDLSRTAWTTDATLLFASNIAFWRMSNYFAHGTQTWPLLHTWSLGVEEQFYIFFPLLVRIVRVRGRIFALLLTLLALASFVAAYYAVAHRNGTIAFYLVPFRAWELLAGSILATGVIPPLSRWWARSIVGLAGLAGILLPMATTLLPLPFPGLGAVAPVLGAAAVIYAGSGGKHLVSPILSWKPIVFVGLISYSLYLWHWPVLAFARYWAIDDPLTPGQAIAAVAAAFVLATLSWRFVERPFRRASVSDRTIWIWSAVGSVLLLAVATLMMKTHGLPGRVPAAVARLNDASDRTWKCPLPSFVRFGNALACPINLPSKRAEDADVILWGDSHAQMYTPALRQALGDRTGLLVYSYGCAPVLGDAMTPACGEVQRANYARIIASRASTVIVAESWQEYRDEGARYTGLTPQPSERYQYAVQRLRALVAGLRQAGKKVIIVSAIPIPGYDVAGVGSRELLFYGRVKHPTSVTHEEYLIEVANVRAAMTDLAQDPGVTPVWIDRMMCPNGRCDYIQDGRSIFADHDHLSSGYAASLWPLFRQALDDSARHGGSAGPREQ